MMSSKRAKYLLDTFGEKLIAREVNGTTIEIGGRRFRALALTRPDGSPAKSWKFTITENEAREQLSYRIDRILDADPTPAKQYGVWITRQWIAGNIRFNDDFYKVSNWLVEFHALKTAGYFNQSDKSADINSFDVDGLADLVESVREYKSNREQERSIEASFYESRQADLILDDAETRVVQINSHEASCHFGRNTRWCTAASGDAKTFASYRFRGPLIIILDKANNLRWQVHFSQSLPHTQAELARINPFEFPRDDSPVDVQMLDDKDHSITNWENPSLQKAIRLL